MDDSVEYTVLLRTYHITLQLEFRNPKVAWITDMVVMADEYKMIFSSIDNSLGI